MDIWIVAWRQSSFMTKEGFLAFDNYEEALKCYEEYRDTCDEVRIVDTRLYHKYQLD